MGNRSSDDRVLKSHPFLRRFRKYQDGIINAFFDMVDCRELRSPKQIVEQLFMDCALYDQGGNNGSSGGKRNWKYYLARCIRKYRLEAVNFAKAVLCERVPETVEFSVETRKIFSENQCRNCNCSPNDDVAWRNDLCLECGGTEIRSAKVIMAEKKIAEKKNKEDELSRLLREELESKLCL